MLAFDTLFSCQGARVTGDAHSMSAPGLLANAPNSAFKVRRPKPPLRSEIVAHMSWIGKSRGDFVGLRAPRNQRTKRTNLRFPTCTMAPRTEAVSSTSSVTFSPSTRTAP